MMRMKAKKFYPKKNSKILPLPKSNQGYKKLGDKADSEKIKEKCHSDSNGKEFFKMVKMMIM